jgi:16S rRNA (adenine1518-N6/adenine1519-N6)-dimethyltransferase
MKVVAKRSLGQNFLTSPRTAESIVHLANITDIKTVFEVGPGHGMLTRALLNSGKKVIAVEKDDALFKELSETFLKEITEKKLILIHGDALIVETHPHFIKHIRGNYAIVANIPYNITGQLIPFFLHLKPKPQSITLMVQYEVAKRICDTQNEGESILSLSVKAFATPKFLKKISAGSFTPAPNVDSALLQLLPHAKTIFTDVLEKDFFDLIKKGFAHKRKVLKNNIGATSELFTQCNLSEKVRAEELTLTDWVCLLKNNV